MGKRRAPRGTQTRTTTTVETLPADSTPKLAMQRAWENVANMTLEAAVAAVWTVPGIEGIEVARKERGEFWKKGTMTPGDPNPEDAEQWITSRWGAGVYTLAPLHRGTRVRMRSFPLGGEQAYDGGAGPGGDDPLAKADQLLHDQLRRAAAMDMLNKLKPEGDDTMKAEDIKALADAIRGGDGGGSSSAVVEVLKVQNDMLMKMLQMERDRVDRLTTEKTAAPATDPNTMMGMVGLLAPLLGRMKSSTLNSIINAVMRVLRPQEAPPETGWTPDAVMQTIQAAGPIIQNFLAPLLAQMGAQLGVAVGAPAAPGAPALTPRSVEVSPNAVQTGDGPMPIELDPEEKEALDDFFRYIGEKDFESAWSVLGNTTEETSLLNEAILGLNDNQRSETLRPLYMKYDIRAKDSQPLLAYLEWGKVTKRPEVLARLEELTRRAEKEALDAEQKIQNGR